MVNDFIASIAPEPFTVLGVSLRPLTFGHVCLLSRFGLEPVKNERGLLMAVEICSRSYQEAIAWVGEIFTPMGQAKLEDRIAMIQSLPLEDAFLAWFGYLDANGSHPECCPSDGPPSDKGAPFLSQMRVWLMGHCNYSPEYILEAPWGQCLWDYAASMEESNGWGIVGDKHRAIADLLDDARN